MWVHVRTASVSLNEAVLTYMYTHNVCFRAKIRNNVYLCKPQLYGCVIIMEADKHAMKLNILGHRLVQLACILHTPRHGFFTEINVDHLMSQECFKSS